MYEFIPLKLKGAFEIRFKSFSDARGILKKTLHRSSFEKAGLNCEFVEQLYTVSHKDVVRGMHFQVPPYDHEKLVHCIKGRATDVILDLRKSSGTYGQWDKVELSEAVASMVYIPRGMAHGYHALDNETIMLYGVTSEHEPGADAGVRWDSFGYDWGVGSPILSERDQKLAAFNEYASPF